jgi:hypothetical protein
MPCARSAAHFLILAVGARNSQSGLHAPGRESRAGRLSFRYVGLYGVIDDLLLPMSTTTLEYDSEPEHSMMEFCVESIRLQ